MAVLGEIRGGGPVWDVASRGTVCVLVADCLRPQSRARLNAETMTVSFEEFSPTHEFFDYTGVLRDGHPPARRHTPRMQKAGPFCVSLQQLGAFLL